MKETTVPQSSYPGPYIPALNNLWCHTGNKQPGEEKRGTGGEEVIHTELFVSCMKTMQRSTALIFKFSSSDDSGYSNQAAFGSLTLLMMRLEKKEGVFSRCTWKLSAIRASGPTEK